MVVAAAFEDEVESAAARRSGQIEPGSECTDALFSFGGQAGGLAVESNGTILVSDASSGTIWRVAQDATATPVAVVPAHLDTGWEDQTRLFTPAGLARSPDGSLFVADSTRHRVCAVSPEGLVRVVAGGANGYRDGPGTEAMFRYPLDVALAADGTCYVADTGNDCIRAIFPDGMVATIAGSNYDFGDGRGPDARFRRPAALDCDGGGVCWVADTGNNAIRRVTPDGLVTTLAGEPPGGDRDVSGRGVGLRWPTGIAVEPDGSVWVADHGNGALRHITATGETTTRLRLTGLRWPLAVARSGDGSVAVAGSALDDVRVPEACVMVLSNPH